MGIVERKPPPTPKEFAQRFVDYVQTRRAEKPKTVEFYAQQMARLLEFEPLASSRLHTVEENLIEKFVQWRSQQAKRAGANRKRKAAAKPKKPISAATVKRSLAGFRKLLRLGCEWRLINRIPRIRLLPGERNREFILTHAQERLYLEMAPQPLQHVATLILDTGLRIGAALALEWPDIPLEPAFGAKFGYLHVRDGKSRFARRNVPLTVRVRDMLESRNAESKTPWVFAESASRPMLNSSLDPVHKDLRETQRMPGEFVIHSLRHTHGTRLGEAGADAFTIMRRMGHASVWTSQRYIHPAPGALERALERLEGLNQKATNSLPDGQKRQLPATISATVSEVMPVSH